MDKEYPFLGRLASGEEVWDRDVESLLTGDEGVFRKKGLLQALAQIESGSRQTIEYEAKFEKVVGWDSLVQTEPDQRGIVWIQIPGSAGHFRVSLRGAGSVRREPTKSLTVILDRRAAGGYTLRTFWFGPWRPQLPWDPGAGPEALAFWMSHAFLASTMETEWMLTMKTEIPPEWMEAMNKFGDCAVVKAAINAKPIHDPDVERMRRADLAIFEFVKEWHDPSTTKH